MILVSSPMCLFLSKLALISNMNFFLVLTDGDEEDNSLPSQFDSSFLQGDSGSPSHSPRGGATTSSPSHGRTSPVQQQSISPSTLNGVDTNTDDNSNDDTSNNNNSNSKSHGPNFLYEESKLSAACFPFHHPLQQQTSSRGLRLDFPYVSSPTSTTVKSEVGVVFPKLGGTPYNLTVSQDAIAHHRSAGSIIGASGADLADSENKRNIDSHGMTMESVFPHMSQMSEVQGAST